MANSGWGEFAWGGAPWGGGLLRAQILERRRANIIWLVEIALRGPSAIVLYFSDRNILHDNINYEAYVTEVTGVSSISERFGESPLNDDISITFKNMAWRDYAHLVEVGDTEPFEGAIVTIKEIMIYCPPPSNFI